MSMIHKDLYEFGPFSLDPHERILLRAGTLVATTPKVFDTLLVLVRNQGRVLTKDELLQAIWPGTFVEEVNLAVNISTLRKLLGESPQDGRYIVTVSGRGYRFVAEVRETSPASELRLDRKIGSFNDSGDVDESEEPVADDLRLRASPSSLGQVGTINAVETDRANAARAEPDGTVHLTPQTRSTGLRFGAAFAILLLLLAGVGVYLWRQHHVLKSSPPNASIAVLPFADLSPGKDQEYFSDGLADELTNDLQKVRGLKVIARSSAFQFKGKNEDLRMVGHKLGVANILEGSVRSEGNRVRITVALTKADDGFLLWSETYDRQVDNVFAVQGEIAHAVSMALQVRILDPHLEIDSSHFRRNPTAYEPYLQAQYFLARGEDKEDLKKALDYADQAIRIDPGFAPVWALRSVVINTAATIGLKEHEKSYLEARDNAERAIALDPNSASGYLALAWLKTGYGWDWDGADTALKKAADLQPGSAVVLSYRAYLYECLGRLDEAIALTQEASILDPLRTNAYLGSLLLTAGRYDEARASVEKALSINPKLEGAHAKLGGILLAQGHAQAALAEMDAEPGEWERLTGQALVYHALGRTHDSDAALSRLIATHAEDSPYQVAEIYAYRGELDQAFQWLERSYLQRDPGLNQLKLDPLIQNLRTDRRYLDLLRKMKLPA
jgi:TolB-like protein/DNA-binding winged helix-turn-helix (wHTH) protein/Flp pilus assembly protein TadD